MATSQGPPNSTGSEGMQEMEDFTTVDTVSAVYYFTMFVLIVPLNALVIYTLVRQESRKSRLHFFILNLAIADLLVGLITVLGDGIVSAMFGTWYGGDVICRAWRYLKTALLFVSNDLLIGLSIDRLLAIAFPMMVMKKGSILYKALVLGAWVVPFLLSVFYLIYSKGVDGPQGYCDLELDPAWYAPFFWVIALVVYIMPTLIIPFFWVIALVVYIVPTLIVVFCYVTICVVVWRKWKENQGLSELNRAAPDANATANNKPSILSRAKVKSVKMTLVICLAFFLCWTPYFVVTFAIIYGRQISASAYTAVAGLYCLNSLSNPLVFILFNRDKFLPQGGGGCCEKHARDSTSEEPVTLESCE